MKATVPCVPVSSMEVTVNASPRSASESLPRGSMLTAGPSSPVVIVSFAATGASFTPLIVTVTWAVSVRFALSLIVYLNVVVAV